MWSWIKKKSFGHHQHTITAERDARGGLSASAPDLTEDDDHKHIIQLEKICNHGFPIAASCMEYDPYHKLLMIGTNTGEVRVLGRPGVELSAIHDEVTRVLQILPLAEEPSLITVCSNNKLHKWSYFSIEDGTSELVLERSYILSGGTPKTITTACLPPNSDSIFVGTLGGVTYPIDVHLYGMSPEIISPARARDRLGFKEERDPGAVQCIVMNPTNKRQLLIGHETNYFELWDVFSTKPLKIITPPEDLGPLASLQWHGNGHEFLTGHRDGYLVHWDLEGSQDNHNVVSKKKQFDCEDCREIHHLVWPSDHLTIFSGGVPSDLFDGDTITVKEREEKVTLQLTSAVRSMRVIEDQVVDMDSGMIDTTSDSEASMSARKVLILLLEQEILFIELTMPELPLLLPPYLHSLHNSPVKCQQVHSDIKADVWQLLDKAGSLQNSSTYQAKIKTWPIQGGHVEHYSSKHKRDLLITGHEDGTVKFWDISQVYFRLLYTLRTAHYFNVEGENPGVDDSPVHQGGSRFKSVGFWDPRGDDERLMVTSVCLEGWYLAIGFHGGQTIVFKLNNQKAKHSIRYSRIILMKDFMSLHPSLWSNPLGVKEGDLEFEPGFQPSHYYQLLPASSVTTLAVSSTLQLVGLGSYYGFGVMDLIQDVTNLVHCTYDPEQPEQNLSRIQSIRKSFRQSLRRFNLRRSLRASQSARRTLRPGQLQRGYSARGGGAVATMAPVKRDSVRVMKFTSPLQVHGPYPTPTLWVGTGLGSVYGYHIQMPSSVDRELKVVEILQLEKEYGKKKKFSTIYVGILDGHSMLEEKDTYQVSKYSPRPDGKLGHYHGHHHHGHHQYVTVVTEEEIRILALSNGKKKFKAKLKLNEEDGYHLVSAHYVRTGDQPAIMILDTEGHIHVFGLPDLKPLYKAWCLDGADAVGQRSFIATHSGLALHMRSPSEFARLALTEEARAGMKFSSLTRALQLHATGLRKSTDTPISDESTQQQSDERAL